MMVANDTIPCNLDRLYTDRMHIHIPIFFQLRFLSWSHFLPPFPFSFIFPFSSAIPVFYRHPRFLSSRLHPFYRLSRNAPLLDLPLTFPWPSAGAAATWPCEAEVPWTAGSRFATATTARATTASPAANKRVAAAVTGSLELGIALQKLPWPRVRSDFFLFFFCY